MTHHRTPIQGITLVENDIKSFQDPMEKEMQAPIKHFEGELIKIRTGRAHTSLVDDIKVTAYGQETPIKGLATVSVPEASLITIQPWDTSILGDIETAILESDIGVTPVNDGTIIRLQLPKMSAQRRDELIKVLGKKAEECKMAIRNVRKDFNNLMRDAKTKKTISENHFNRLEDVLQKVTDKFTGLVDQMSKKKEQEISAI